MHSFALYRLDSPSSRHMLSRVLGVLLYLILATQTAVAVDAPLSGAVRAFAKEKSLAESYAGLMATIGLEPFSDQQRLRDYAKGIRLYAKARTEFTALVRQLKQELIENEPPTASKEFEAALDAVVKHRIAFTTHVDAMVAAIEAEGQEMRDNVDDYIEGPGELKKILMDAGKCIQTEYRHIQEPARKETMDRLDALKWKPYAEIVSG